MSLNHQIIYRDNLKAAGEEWKNISFHPLAINGIKVDEKDYVEMHDDVLRYFADYWCWVSMYNPATGKSVKGFCYHGVTCIKSLSANKEEPIKEE